MSDDPNISKVFFQKYITQELIGKGSFGTVYSGINTITKEQVAIKLEKKEKNRLGMLEGEAFRLIHLQGEGIPKIHCFGSNPTHHILIQELLGKSLEDLFNAQGKKFSLKTVCVLGIEIIKLIRFIHFKHHLHRDIKPDNFMMGRDDKESRLYVIDFGLGKKYYSASKKEHIKFSKGKTLTGTARYCARNSHRGYEQSRRDDIESIGFLLIYFLLGVLPWQGLKISPGEGQFERIAQKKYDTPFEDLCKGQPEEFVLYFKHADKLAFTEEPNYDYLIGLFQQIINKHCLECYYDFDWKKDHCAYLPVANVNRQNNVSLLANKNNGGQSTLNQSRNPIENSFDNEEEGEANVFINNDNDWESLKDICRDCNDKDVIVIIDGKRRGAIGENSLQNSRYRRASHSSTKSSKENQKEKGHNQKPGCQMTGAPLAKKKFNSIDLSYLHNAFQRNEMLKEMVKNNRKSIEINCKHDILQSKEKKEPYYLKGVNENEVANIPCRSNELANAIKKPSYEVNQASNTKHKAEKGKHHKTGHKHKENAALNCRCLVY